MANDLSDRACDRCRDRRVKCDKRLPTCLRCEKLKKPCPGYDKKRKFVDEGATLRRKFQVVDENSGRPDATSPAPIIQTHALPTNAIPESPINPLVDLAYRSPPFSSLPGGQSVRPLLNSSIAPPDSHPDVLRLVPWQASPHSDVDDEFSVMLDDPEIEQAWFDIDPAEFYGKNDNSCGFIPNLPNNVIVDEVDRNDLIQTLSNAGDNAMSPLAAASNTETWAPESQIATSAIINDEREHEMAYLIRHFTEAIGPWLDLFDREKHFAQLAPLKALRDALLRNAIAAVAAKQLGRTQGSNRFRSAQCQKPATMEVLQGEYAIDWFYKAANYYDKAIAFSRIYIQALSGLLNAPGSPGMQISLAKANSDDLLVAVSIFSLYENLDIGDVSWLQHLSGLKSLFMAVTNNSKSSSQISPLMSVGRKASFWNFARADYQAAYINRQKTYLDTEDFALWRSCGLQIQNNGSLYSDPSAIKNELLGGHEIAELVSHTLLWIVLRVMNYLSATTGTQPPATGAMQWQQLTGQLEQWYETLPATFQPCAQLRHAFYTGMRTQSSAAGVTEVFFSINVCAAAMQLYHFVRILLLLHKPHDMQTLHASTDARNATGTSLLRAYRELSSQTIKHAHQIVGIALGRPHPAVRVEMLLPLSVAGSCLEAHEERALVLELLEAIEKDTGCSTELRVQELKREWHWDSTATAVDAMSIAS